MSSDALPRKGRGFLPGAFDAQPYGSLIWFREPSEHRLAQGVIVTQPRRGGAPNILVAIMVQPDPERPYRFIPRRKSAVILNVADWDAIVAAVNRSLGRAEL